MKRTEILITEHDTVELIGKGEGSKVLVRSNLPGTTRIVVEDDLEQGKVLTIVVDVNWP